MSSVKENVVKEAGRETIKFPFILLFLGFFLGNLFAQPSLEAGKVVVKFNPDAIPVFETRLRSLNKTPSDTSVLITGIQSFDRINRRYRATNMRRVFPDAGKYEAKHRRYGLHLWYEIVIPQGEDPEKVAADYGVDENVQIAEPRYRIRSMAMPALPVPLDEQITRQSQTPNDPDFYRQWNYNNTGQTGGTLGADIRLMDAWVKVKSLGIKNNNVIVAVMDGGVYYDHVDLKANMWENNGYNFVNQSSIISPEDHATHVAGIIGAVTDNGIGVSGIAGSPDEGYGIKIMTVQILDGDKSVESIGPAFTYAADNGAVISQNSWGYEKANVYSNSDIEAINYFINEAGRDENSNPRPGTPMVGGIVIFAAGNDKKDDKWYPAYFDNVLAVAATNHYGKLAWYSNFGNWVNISAPGGDTDERGKNRTGGIYSTSYLTTDVHYYDYMQGTSMACPHVSGVAAMILSVHGSENYTPEMLRARLLHTATPLTAFDPANASKMGAGLVNASEAIKQNQEPMFIGLVTDVTLIPFSTPLVIDLAEYAYDPDNDPLTFHVQTIESNIVNVTINGSNLTIDPRYHGKAELLITASDPFAGRTTAIIHVTVEKKYAPDNPNQLLLYSNLIPNPTTPMEYILEYSYILTEPASVYIRIVNSLGQIMFQTRVEKRAADTYYSQIDLNGWNTGMYIVQYIVNEKIVDTKKMVKQ